MPNVQENRNNYLSGWIALCVAWSFYFYEYILRVFPSVVMNEMMHTFAINASVFGLLSSSYYWAYVPMQIPCGIILDRLGPKKVLLVCVALCVTGCVLMTKTDTLWPAYVGRFLMGMGSACAYLSCAKIAQLFLPLPYFSVVTGITMLMGTLGGSCGSIPFAKLSNLYGWQYSLWIMAVIGLVILTTTIFCVKSVPSKQFLPSELKKDLKHILANKAILRVGIYGCSMYLPLCIFAELLGPSFLMEKYHIINEEAAKGSLAVLISMGIGSAIAPFWCHKIKSHLKVMKWASTLCIGCLLICVSKWQISFTTTIILLCLAGLFSGGQILYFTVAKELAPPHMSATAVGIMNTLVMTSALIFQPIMGGILDLFSSASKDGAALYNTHSYSMTFFVMLSLMIIGRLCLQGVKETYIES